MKRIAVALSLILATGCARHPVWHSTADGTLYLADDNGCLWSILHDPDDTGSVIVLGKCPRRAAADWGATLSDGSR